MLEQFVVMVCNLRIMFHKLDFLIDFSLGVAASYEQMVTRNSEVVTKQ